VTLDVNEKDKKSACCVKKFLSNFKNFFVALLTVDAAFVTICFRV
jgi:hypothetical protein